MDLFAGVGGLSLGFEMAGAATLAVIELNERHAESHARNRVVEILIYIKSILDVEPLEVAREMDISKYELDFLIGAPPCQPFSFLENETEPPISADRSLRNSFGSCETCSREFSLWRTSPG